MRKIKSQSLSAETRDEIFKYIKGNYKEGSTRLPTEDQFAEMLGVSLVTVRAALNELAKEGVIFRRQGKGTFVNQQAVNMKVQFNPVTLFNKMITDCGYTPTVRLLESECQTADTRLSELLQIPPDSPIVVTRKIFYADQNPCAYCEDYFALSILGNPEDLSLMQNYPSSLFDFLDKECGHKIVWDRVEILVTDSAQTPCLDSYFECKGKVQPFLLLDGVDFDHNDQPVVYAKEYVDTHYIKFNSIRQKAYN